MGKWGIGYSLKNNFWQDKIDPKFNRICTCDLFLAFVKDLYTFPLAREKSGQHIQEILYFNFTTCNNYGYKSTDLVPPPTSPPKSKNSKTGYLPSLSS